MAENDIALFLKDFSQTEQTLSDFHDLWRKRNMSCIYYCSPVPREQHQYIKEVFEYVVRGIDQGVLLGKGAIFLLYALFIAQPSSNWLRLNIPITTSEMHNLRALVQSYCDKQVILIMRKWYLSFHLELPFGSLPHCGHQEYHSNQENRFKLFNTTLRVHRPKIFFEC